MSFELVQQEIRTWDPAMLRRLIASACAQLGESAGDAAWEQLIADPQPRPKLEAFLTASRAEGEARSLDFEGK